MANANQESNEEIKRFQSLLKYFVCHLEYCNNKYNPEGLSDTIKTFIRNNGIDKVKPGSGVTTGHGYKGNAIQKQIEQWCTYSVGKVAISVQNERKGGYKTKASYLHWDATDLNINAEWQGDTITQLYYRNIKDPGKTGPYLNISDLFDDKFVAIQALFEAFVNAKKNAIDNKVIGLARILELNYNLILTGAPGTGKTFLTWKIAEKLIGKPSKNPDFKNQFDFVQFHPSYDYTDFVEGLRPEENKGSVIFKRRDGIFKAFCDNAAKDPGNKYVFVIDEINRGEISKIFGELFFSIDPGYRGEFGENGNDNKVKTQYQNLIPENVQIKTGDVEEAAIGNVGVAENGQETEKPITYSFDKGFYVPNNVFVIGTMNDIDRSVESMDFAFRRRFAFEEITAAESESMVYNKLGKPGWTSDIIREATDRMRSLNFAIVNSQIGGLTQQYQIGGSYFLKLEKLDFNFQRLWDVFLKGVLYEYYRGQPDAFEKLSQLEDAFNLVDGKGKKNATE